MGAHPHGADAAGKVELAHVFARHGAAYLATHRLVTVQQRALRAIDTCRTAALGGHLERCDACGGLRYRYHSCRNRHCPKCQTLAKERWLTARQAELLPVPYFHRPHRSKRPMHRAVRVSSAPRRPPARSGPHSNSKRRRTEPSGSVQQVLSAMLPHDG